MKVSRKEEIRDKAQERQNKRRTGRRFRIGYEKGIWLVSKTIKWLTPIKNGMTWRENINVLFVTVIVT